MKASSREALSASPAAQGAGSRQWLRKLLPAWAGTVLQGLLQGWEGNACDSSFLNFQTQLRTSASSATALSPVAPDNKLHPRTMQSRIPLCPRRASRTRRSTALAGWFDSLVRASPRLGGQIRAFTSASASASARLPQEPSLRPFAASVEPPPRRHGKVAPAAQLNPAQPSLRPPSLARLGANTNLRQGMDGWMAKMDGRRTHQHEPGQDRAGNEDRTKKKSKPWDPCRLDGAVTGLRWCSATPGPMASPRAEGSTRGVPPANAINNWASGIKHVSPWCLLPTVELRVTNTRPPAAAHGVELFQGATRAPDRDSV